MLATAHSRESDELTRIEARGQAIIQELELLADKADAGALSEVEIARAAHLRESLGIVQERLTLLRVRVQVYHRIARGG